MAKKLTGKVALVTGGSRGIGAADAGDFGFHLDGKRLGRRRREVEGGELQAEGSNVISTVLLIASFGVLSLTRLPR